MPNSEDNMQSVLTDDNATATADTALKAAAMAMIDEDEDIDDDSGTKPWDGTDLEARINRLPMSLRSLIYGDRFGAVNRLLFQEYGIEDKDDREAIVVTVLQVFGGVIPIDEFMDTLWSRLSWGDDQEDRARALGVDILGLHFLPAQAFVGNVLGQLEEYGGDIKDYPVNILVERTMTYDQAVKEIMAVLDTEGFGEINQKRLGGIIESRLREVRDDEEVKQMLTKNWKTGGLELSNEQAASALSAIENVMRMTKFVDVMPEESTKTGEIEHQQNISPEQIRNRLAGTSEEQKEVASRIEKLESDTGGDTAIIRDLLHDLIYRLTSGDNGQWDVVAVLMALARNGGLLPSLADDPRFVKAMIAFMEDRELEEGLDEVQSQPSGQKAVNLFLQLVLRGVALLGEEDSARYGLRIINILKRQGHTQFAGLVAFDVDQDRFVWTMPVQM